MASDRDAGSEPATHEPTARRIADARRGGQVAQSADLRGALALAATGVSVALLAPSIAGQLVTGFATALRRAPRGEPLAAAAARGLDTGARVLAVPLAVAFAVTLLVGLLQTGGLWLGVSRSALGGRSIGARLRHLWGGSALAGALAGLGKAALVAVVAALALSGLVPQLVRLAGVPAARALAAFGAAAHSLGARLLLILLAIGAADYAWARWRYRRALRMTSRELERERREREGDPLPRAERRRQHGALATGPSIGADLARAVRDASVVVIGGGARVSVAVALSHDRAGARAPIVVAAARPGAAVAAAALLAAARAAGVPVVDGAALAGALVEVDLGAEIPASLYEGVAEILRHVLTTGGAPPDPPPMPHGASATDA